jgi:pyridoxine/pyridoxamine 5'-phosphate oxidase
MTARFSKMVAKLPQFQNLYKVVVGATPASQAEMEQSVQVYERNFDGKDVLVPPHAWGFTYSDVASKDVEIKAEAMAQLREQRNALLTETDKITMMCYSRGIPVPDDWSTYQQDLRDLPENSSPDLADDGSLIGVTWPTQPATKP